MMRDFQQETRKVLQALVQPPQHPQRPFVHRGATAGEVYRMAGQLITLLRQRGLCENQRICLAVEDKALIAAAMLASLGGGPAFVLPYAVSDNALQGMQEQGLLDAVITDVAREIPADTEVLSADALQQAQPSPLVWDGNASRELLYVYTGGSTGAPQLWPKSQENLLGEGVFHKTRFGITPQDVILATVPPYHIYGLLFSVIMPLITQAAVVQTIPTFPEEIARTVAKHQVTVLASVPANYRTLAGRALGVRLAFSSAGVLAEADNDNFCKVNEAGIIEVFGSTETGGLATRNRALGEQWFTPFATIAWMLEDDCLAVRSPYISANLPVDDEGFFTTQDRIEKVSDTTFRLLGRADHVIKVGGKRVDLETVAGLVKEVAGVVDCVVTAYTMPGGRQSWIGALVQGNVDAAVVKSALARSLEPYALPRRILVVAAIPMKANGKYDRDAIKELLTA